jgi:5-bromo-4-chloroindolyl phosphate hydrolysis protein
MESDPRHERETRAARNQALFRAANEKARALNETFARLTSKFTITCECADTGCIETIEILPQEYLAIRAEPRQFAVLPGHVYPDVDSVVRGRDGYAVVEMEGEAAGSSGRGRIEETRTELVRLLGQLRPQPRGIWIEARV